MSFFRSAFSIRILNHLKKSHHWFREAKTSIVTPSSSSFRLLIGKIFCSLETTNVEDERLNRKRFMGTESGSDPESSSKGWSRARGLVVKTLVLVGGALLLKRLTKSTTRRDHARLLSRSLTGEKFSREQASRDPENYFNIRMLSCPAAEMVDGSEVLYLEQAFWRTPQKPFRQRSYMERKILSGTCR